MGCIFVHRLDLPAPLVVHPDHPSIPSHTRTFEKRVPRLSARSDPHGSGARAEAPRVINRSAMGPRCR